MTTPTLAHGFMAASIFRRTFLAVCLHPGWGSVACWVWWRILTLPELVASTVPTVRSVNAVCSIERGISTLSDGATVAFARPMCTLVEPGAGTTLAISEYKMAGPAGVLGYVTDVVQFAGLALGTAAVLFFVLSLFTTPTHAVGADRRLRATGRGLARPTLAARASRRGAYTRIKAGHDGVVADWKTAKQRSTDVDKRAARVGRWRLTRWGRQWAAERARGVPESGLTRPRFYDRWLFRRVEPPKTKVGRRIVKRRAEKKAERRAGPAAYQSDAVGSLLDPTDGPPLSPTQRDRYADRLDGEARAVRDDAAAARNRVAADVLAMQDGHEPVSAGNGSRP